MPAKLRPALGDSLRIVRRGLPLIAVGFLADSAFIFLFLIALQAYLPESLHASPALAGYALAAFGIAKLASQTASGVVSDRLGTRPAMIIGTALLLSAGGSMWPLAHVAPYAIVAAAALEGIGSSVLWPAIYAAGNSRFEADERTRFTSLLTLATMGALAVGLGGGTLLDLYVSFDMAMIFAVSLSALAFAIALLTPVSAREAAERETAEAPSLRELPAIVRSRQRLAFSAIVVAESIGLGAVAASFRAYGRDVAHVSLTHEGLLLAPAAVLGGLCVVAGGAIADRLGARRVMAPGFAVAGIAVLLLAAFTHTGAIVVIAAVGGAGFGLALPTVASTMMALAGDAGHRGGIIGWFMTMDGLGHSIGPACAAVLLATFDARAVLLLVGAAFVAVSLIAASQPLAEADARVTSTEEEPGGQALTTKRGRDGYDAQDPGDRRGRIHRLARRRGTARAG
ncbi:MAG TPA: MFS transporter [Dehalococcoidia bacterium]|nr:MFS transporter [Dehalococcoidia bacterium]